MKKGLVLFIGFLISFVFWFAIYINTKGIYSWVVAFYGILITWMFLIVGVDSEYRRREAKKKHDLTLGY
jgi:hypothetical protein